MAEKKKLSTDSYKGVRDFYPDDMAVQQYIFDVWSMTAESFGYERYDASVLEPAELYKSKGAENEELVNEQTYTFTDRGDREVTLRPEMTPTVARMIAARRRELFFPVRWYSIPNLFRYERSQRGRLREHWQLNADIFGSDDVSADIEVITLAYQTLLNFGADPEMFEIRVNNRKVYSEILLALAKKHDTDLTELQVREVIRLSDKLGKIPQPDFAKQLTEIVGEKIFNAISEFLTTQNVITELKPKSLEQHDDVMNGLKELGIEVKHDPTLARGFDYYTGTIFEIFDTSGENNRALIGGGRYDNLTELFGGDPIPGVGFGMGDVTMLDFLETHNLLTSNISSPELVVIPTDAAFNIEGQKIAQQFRAAGVSTSVDIGTKKLDKKIAAAGDRLVSYALVFGDDEEKSGTYTLKNLETREETPGTLDELIRKLSSS